MFVGFRDLACSKDNLFNLDPFIVVAKIAENVVTECIYNADLNERCTSHN